MINLNSEICRKIRDARRTAKLSQSVVAAEIGCKQSALSMFEQGDGTKLNDECVEKLARRFNIDLKDACSESVKTIQPISTVRPVQSETTRGFCPNPHCPSNKAYQVEGRDLILPNRTMADPVGGKFCAMCGELLEKKCPNCGAPVHDGGICSLCGEPYVTICPL